MAHADSFTKQDMKKIAKEHCRELQEYRNYVDSSKSNLNYHMNTGLKDSNDFLLATQRRVNEIMDGRDIQKQTNVISEWVVSCPQELLGDDKQVRQFFGLVYAFCQARYGKANVIDGYVHMDETTPHMHVCVVPEATSRKTGRKTVSSASLLTRRELSDFHSDLDKECEIKFGRSKLIKNGKGKGNLGLREWKDQQARDKAHEKEIQEYRDFMAGVKFKDGKSVLDKFDAMKQEAQRRAKLEAERQAEQEQEKPAAEDGFRPIGELPTRDGKKSRTCDAIFTEMKLQQGKGDGLGLG